MKHIKIEYKTYTPPAIKTLIVSQNDLYIIQKTDKLLEK